MIYRKLKYFIISLFVLYANYPGQTNYLSDEHIKSIGTPYIKNFKIKDYNANPQNWDMAQDNRGVLYFANSNGVLEYDGINWRIIYTDNKSLVRSLAADSEGRIYVGADKEFGYLSPDSTGGMKFISLSKSLNKKYQDFNEVWHVINYKGNIYFFTKKYVFCYSRKTLSVISKTSDSYGGFVINNELYTWQKEAGLAKLDAEAFVETMYGKIFKGFRVYSMLPYGEEHALVYTREMGHYLISNASVKKASFEVDKILSDAKVYKSLLLDGKYFVYATLEKGIVIFNKKGELLKILNKSTGIVDNQILNVFCDRQNNLWLLTNNGISRVEINSPFLFINENFGITSNIYAVRNYGDIIYAGTHMGAYYLRDINNPYINSGKNLFRQIDKIYLCLDLLFAKNSILCASISGVYSIKNERIHKKVLDLPAFTFCKSKIDTNRIFVGLSKGIASIYYSNGDWRFERTLPNYNKETRYLFEDNKGRLWSSSLIGGPVLIELEADNVNVNKVTEFKDNDGIAAKGTCRIFKFNDILLFSTSDNLYYYDEPNMRFTPYNKLTSLFDFNSITIERLYQLDEKNIIIRFVNINKNIKKGASPYETGIASLQSNNEFVWDPIPFKRINDFNIYSIFINKEDDIYFGGVDGIIKYNTKMRKDRGVNFNAIIRRVLINKDFSIYNGCRTIFYKEQTLDYDKNNMRFEFAAAFYEEEAKNQFQYYLEGYDKEWSNWTTETWADYTGLPPGTYKFYVRAKNTYDKISSIDAYEFEISTPYYKTIYAYIFYVLILIGGVYLYLKYRIRKVEKEKIELELIVKNRTNELLDKTEKLEKTDKIKSTFFTNISHEFRTPLSLIISPLNQFIDKSKNERDIQLYRTMLIQANRLLTLVDQLLDLAKVESGAMSLKMERGNINELLRVIVASYESKAKEKKIKLSFIENIKSGYLYFDRDKIEKIFYNLISNAFKFTEPNGRINICIELQDKSKKEKKNNRLIIKIQNTGDEIIKNEMDLIFDRFYQSQNPKYKDAAGFGIGLALTKELIELHKGQIKVDCKEGVTEFSVLFPYDQSLYLEDHAIEVGDEFSVGIEEPEINDSSFDVKNLDDYRDDAKEKILIIEDNPDLRKYLTDSFKDSYCIIEADNGKLGVELANSIMPDLIISDIMMPIMNGFEVLKSIKTNLITSHIPIILLTAKAEDEDKIKGLEYGVDDYVLKPFNLKELTLRADNLIKNRIQLRKKFEKNIQINPSEMTVTSVDEEFLIRIGKIIENNMDDDKLDVEYLSKQIGMSRQHLYRKIKALTNQTPSEFIRIIRLKMAAQLIKNKCGNVSEIAYKVGFNNLSYFAERFKKHFGVNPSEYE